MESLPTFSAPTSDERLMAALSHFLGPIVALIIWATQKDRSRFLRFQTLQALAFSGVMMLFSFLLSFCMVSGIFVSMFAMVFSAVNQPVSADNVPYFLLIPSMFPFGLFALVMPFSLAVLVARLIASLSVLNGRNFHYPILGRKVEEFVGLP